MPQHDSRTITDLRGALAKAEETIDELQSMIADLNRELRQANERIESYEVEVTTSRRVIADLIGDSREMDRELDAYLEKARAIGANTPLAMYFEEPEDDAK